MDGTNSVVKLQPNQDQRTSEDILVHCVLLINCVYSKEELFDFIQINKYLLNAKTDY